MQALCSPLWHIDVFTYAAVACLTISHLESFEEWTFQFPNFTLVETFPLVLSTQAT